jgi:hypothetical protein
MDQQPEATQTRESECFDDILEQLGKQMAAWGEEFGQRMEAWGEEFGCRMEAWGKEFRPCMEARAEEMARKMTQLGERIGQWFEEEAGSTAGADNLREERLVILRMVDEGKISVTEAEGLLRALGE